MAFICTKLRLGYIAPEILLGSEPDIKSDIYSLGVTIFELLIREKVEINPEMQGDSRIREFKKIRKRIGNEVQPILNMIEAAIQLSPRDRASSYQELLKIIGEKSHVISSTNIKADDDVVAEARVLQKQGLMQEAINQLQNYLADDNDNPVVLNALGCCYLRLKDKEQAAIYFEKASRQLTNKSGMHDDRLYPDPFVNLANIYRVSGDFVKAFMLLEQVWSWGHQGHDPIINNFYPELGWFLLFKGDFAQSCHHVLNLYRWMSPDMESIKWLILAAYLTKRFDQYAEKLSRLFTSFSVFDLSTALLAIFVANSLNPEEQKVLHHRALSYCYRELKQLSDEMGMSYAFERFPLHPKVVYIILNSLDTFITGGKYDGILRQSFQSSLE